MQDLLKDIKNIPSVMGSYIHIQGFKEINSDLPKIFLGKMQEIGEVFDRVSKVNQATNMHAVMIEFKFDEAIIFLRLIDQDSSLITFCETDVNKKAVSMTTGMVINDLKLAIEEIRKGGKKATPAPPQTAPPATETKKEPARKKVDVNKIIHAGPLAKVIQAFQDALALAIGPISEMVIKDSVQVWAEKGECSQERLPELIDMLIQEIDDPSLEAEFKVAIKKYLI